MLVDQARCRGESRSMLQEDRSGTPAEARDVKGLITISKEDYLKAILEAESEGQAVIPAILAHWLSVSPPAVTMALKRLRRDKYLEVKPDGIIRLTPKGKEIAYRTALRHHLIERMLAELFGME